MGVSNDTVGFINSELVRCMNDDKFINLTDSEKVGFFYDLITMICQVRQNSLILKGDN